MNNVKRILISKIKANPFQPRQQFDQQELDELAASIKQYGVLQPLLVSEEDDGTYLLVAGERRLRASKLIGLKDVPCVIGEYDDHQKAEVALIENLQRADLNFLEEAEGMHRLLEEFSLTQEELAIHLSKSQPAIANKLRILRLNSDIRQQLLKANLTERHARALLKLNDAQQKEAIKHIIKYKLNVKQTDDFTNKMIAPKPPTHRSIVVSDVRVYLNSFRQLVDTMNMGGIKSTFNYKMDNDQIVITVKIDNKKRHQ